jgi:3-methyladenine DNA glycosylase/8-oxoguanine DNA glycosylase
MAASPPTIDGVRERTERSRHDPSEEVTHGRLDTRAPFHLEATVRVLQRRPSNPVDVWARERYLRALPAGDDLALLEVYEQGTIDHPDVRFSVWQNRASRARGAELAQAARKILGLDVDPGPLQHAGEAVRLLRPTARALRGMRPPRFADFFEAFANVIPFQQVSLDAGIATVGRLVERFGNCVEHDGRRFRAFPTAQRIGDVRLDGLRRCGLSSRKAESLRRVARAIESGELSEQEVARMDTRDALRILDELPGIGPWSASVVLLRGLGRLDVFPPGDVGATRGLATLMKLRPEASLQPTIERFADHRGYLYFFSLGRALLARGLIHAAPACGSQEAEDSITRTACTGQRSG